ncbi:uncharacterized protein BO88DRAFT_400531 [Aspergillus vadensis CBS 113365]|uniref:Uncharacterized protein n=1 Tax=Aspergillus vadensis (strain CBS 113365 / IMI 142717 / IBT 24658) TaxID=1448311 RepID=A0A319BUA0_ASPVC|nr:hypothetical protein BO88DRAFT_400531 [Aspergillus vadensis CBS 113365]PYH74870.1 hypothetical protein BO88DRAFT_400531 [Aspergillus vadensis CBS 113365]
MHAAYLLKGIGFAQATWSLFLGVSVSVSMWSSTDYRIRIASLHHGASGTPKYR